MERVRLRAWIVSRVAPQTPTSPLLVKRQGPMPHCLQHMPAPPILHGTMLSARVNAVPMPSSSARISICWAAGSLEYSLISRFLAIVLLLIHLHRANARAMPERASLIHYRLAKTHGLFGCLICDGMAEVTVLSLGRLFSRTCFDGQRPFTKIARIIEL